MLVKKVDVRSTGAALQLSAAVGRDVRVQRDGAGRRGLLLPAAGCLQGPGGVPCTLSAFPKAVSCGEPPCLRSSCASGEVPWSRH